MLPQAPRLHELQKQALIDAGYSSNEITEISDRLGSEPSQISRSSRQEVSAGVFTPLIELNAPDRGSVSIVTQPSIIFNIPTRPKPDSQICPGVPLHELVHVVQFLDNPIYDQNGKLDRELEAYAAQARLLWSASIPYSLDTAMATVVDDQRRKDLGPNVYTANTAFKEMLAKDSLLAQIIRD